MNESTWLIQPTEDFDDSLDWEWFECDSEEEALKTFVWYYGLGVAYRITERPVGHPWQKLQIKEGVTGVGCRVIKPDEEK